LKNDKTLNDNDKKSSSSKNPEWGRAVDNAKALLLQVSKEAEWQIYAARIEAVLKDEGGVVHTTIIDGTPLVTREQNGVASEALLQVSCIMMYDSDVTDDIIFRQDERKLTRMWLTIWKRPPLSTHVCRHSFFLFKPLFTHVFLGICVLWAFLKKT